MPPEQSAELVPESEHKHQLTTTPTQEITVGGMLQAAIAGGVSKENVDVLEKLMNLYERDQARRAEMAFNAAFVALQAEMPKVKAVKPVPDRDGNIKYFFAPYEEIDAQVRPFLQKHGFSTSFSQSYTDGRVSQTCILRHAAGHKQENTFSVRIGKGPPGSSEAQGDGAASTYAKRHAFCNALDIVIDNDTDGKSEIADIGEAISRDQVQYLKELIDETKSDVPKLLALAGADSLEKIGTGQYRVVVNLLLSKRR